MKTKGNQEKDNQNKQTLGKFVIRVFECSIKERSAMIIKQEYIEMKKESEVKKRNSIFIIHSTLILLLILCCGCVSMNGGSVSSEVNTRFKIEQYTRYFINAKEGNLCYKPVSRVLIDQGILPYNGDIKRSKLEVYFTNREGVCFPPRWDSSSYYLFRFTYPREATVVFKDAVTKQVLINLTYERAFFAINAGYKECKSLIQEKLANAILQSRIRNLPTPIKADSGSYSGD